MLTAISAQIRLMHNILTQISQDMLLSADPDEITSPGVLGPAAQHLLRCFAPYASNLRERLEGGFSRGIQVLHYFQAMQFHKLHCTVWAHALNAACEVLLKRSRCR